LQDYDGKVRLVVRYMPLHHNSLRAAALTEAAGEQGKYWEMQELLFRKQPEWGERHGAPPAAQPTNVSALFEKYAMELGLDLEKVNGAMRENRYQAKLERDLRDGQTLGVRKTPTFFVNGRMLMRFSEADLRALINDELKKTS
jgi:protein-disulfide isomerase